MRTALLAAAGLGCLGLPGAGAGYLALLGLMLAYTGVLPVLLAWLARTAAARLPADGLPLARMAVRNLGRHLARTSAAVAALSVAFAAAFGMAMMIASFRDGVNDWLLRLLNADFYATARPEGGEVPPLRRACSKHCSTIRPSPRSPATGGWRFRSTAGRCS